MPDNNERETKTKDVRFDNTLEKKNTRRSFLKNAVVAGLAITTGAGIAKKATDAVLKEDNRKLYLADELGVERTWKGRKLYLMSKNEKKQMVTALLDSFASNGK